MAKKSTYPESIIELAAIAKALSHPARAFLINKLSHQDACCYSGDIAEEINIGRSTLSQHLKELKMAGLIQGEIEPPYIKYCINRPNYEKARKYFKEFFEI